MPPVQHQNGRCNHRLLAQLAAPPLHSASPHNRKHLQASRVGVEQAPQRRQFAQLVHTERAASQSVTYCTLCTL